MTNKHQIREIIESWHNTGKLKANQEQIKEIRKAYLAIRDNAVMLPNYNLMWRDAIKELDTIERIMEARGIDFKKNP